MKFAFQLFSFSVFAVGASLAGTCLPRAWLKFPYTGHQSVTVSGKPCVRWNLTENVVLWNLRTVTLEEETPNQQDLKLTFGYGKGETGTPSSRLAAPGRLFENLCASGCPIDPETVLELEKYGNGNKMLRDVYEFCRQWTNRGPWCFTEDLRAEECFFACEDIKQSISYENDCMGKTWSSRWWSVLDKRQSDRLGPDEALSLYIYTSGGVKSGPALNSYQGPKSTSASGKKCLPWSKVSSEIFINKLYLPEHNYCRQPFHSPSPYGPYCVIELEEDGQYYQVAEPCFPICEDLLIKCVGDSVGSWLGPFGVTEDDDYGNTDDGEKKKKCDKKWRKTKIRRTELTMDNAYGFTEKDCANKYWEPKSTPFCSVSGRNRNTGTPCFECKEGGEVEEEIFEVPAEFKDVSCMTEDVYSFFREAMERTFKRGKSVKDPTVSVPDLPVYLKAWLSGKAPELFTTMEDFQVMNFPKKVALNGLPCVEHKIGGSGQEVVFKGVCQLWFDDKTVTQKGFPWVNVPWCFTHSNGEWDLCYSLCSHDSLPCVPFSHDKNHPFTPESATPFSVPADAPKKFPGVIPYNVYPYRGSKHTTVSGAECVKWVEAHEKNKDPENFYNRRPCNRCFNGLYVGKKHRQRGVTRWWMDGGPWCFTDITGDDPLKWKWEYCFDTCDVKKENGNFMETSMHRYIHKFLLYPRQRIFMLTGFGRKSTTKKGAPCKKGTDLVIKHGVSYPYNSSEPSPKFLSDDIRFLESCRIGSTVLRSPEVTDSLPLNGESLDFMCQENKSGKWTSCWTTEPEREKKFCQEDTCSFETYSRPFEMESGNEMEKESAPVFLYPETETDGGTEKRFRYLQERYIGCRRADDPMEWYRGTQAITVNEQGCQRWDSQEPHPHNFTKKDFARLFGVGSLRMQEDYCRNPDKSSAGPWCFTLDDTVIREPCFNVCLNRNLQGTCLKKDGWPWINPECNKRKLPSSDRDFVEQGCQAADKDSIHEYGFLWNDEVLREEPKRKRLDSISPTNHLLGLKESLYISRVGDYRTPHCIRSESADLMGPWTYVYTPYKDRIKYVNLAEGNSEWRKSYPVFSTRDDQNQRLTSLSLEDCKGKCWMKPCFSACEDSELKCIERKMLGLYNYQGPKETSISGKHCLAWNDTALNHRYRNTIWNWIFLSEGFSKKPLEDLEESDDFPAENFLFQLQLKMMNSRRCLNLRLFMDTDKLPFRLPDEMNRGPFCFVEMELHGETVEKPEPCFPACEDLLAETRDCIPSEQMSDYLYTGSRKKGFEGKDCLMWREREKGVYIPWNLGDLGENFCRNPDGDPKGPWCLSPSFKKQHCFKACDSSIENFQLNKRETGEEFSFNPCNGADPSLLVWCQCQNSSCVVPVIPSTPSLLTTETPFFYNFTRPEEEVWNEPAQKLERKSWLSKNIIPILLGLVSVGTYVALVISTIFGCLAFRKQRKQIRKATKQRIALVKEATRTTKRE